MPPAARRAGFGSTNGRRQSPAVTQVPWASCRASQKRASFSSGSSPTTMRAGCRPTASRSPPTSSSSCVSGSSPAPRGPTTCRRCLSRCCPRAMPPPRRGRTTGRFSRSSDRLYQLSLQPKQPAAVRQPSARIQSTPSSFRRWQRRASPSIRRPTREHSSAASTST